MKHNLNTLSILLRGQAAGNAYGYNTSLDTGYGLHLDPGKGQVSLRRWYEWEQLGPINETAARQKPKANKPEALGN